MGGRLEFVDLQHELKDKGIDWDLPICCDSQKSNYSFLRVQMRGIFRFTARRVFGSKTPSTTKNAFVYCALQRNDTVIWFCFRSIASPNR